MDCNKTLGFSYEFNRFCKSFRTDSGLCDIKCPFYDDCPDFDSITQKHIDIVQRWSIDNGPNIRTYAMDFFDKFPNAPKDRLGLPLMCRREVYPEPNEFFVCKKHKDCTECWNDILDIVQH